MDYLDTASVMSAANFGAYPGTTYATQNADEIDGINAIIARGAAGSPIEASGEDFLQQLHSGYFIGKNPNLDAAYQTLVDEAMQKFTEDVLPAIRDAHAFSFGGSDHNIDEAKAAERMMEAINAIGEKVYYDDYRKERHMQSTGIAHVVPYGQREIRDAEMTRIAGVYGREWQQGQYVDAWNMWNENQVLPMRNLDIFGNALRTVMGTARTASVKYYKPPMFAQIAGIALAGIGAVKLFKDTTKSSYANPTASMKEISDDSGPHSSIVDSSVVGGTP